MKINAMSALLFLAPFNKAIGVICSLWLLTGFALGQKAGAPVKPMEEQKNHGAEALIMAKLNHIIIPLIQFENANTEDAIEFLRIRAHELDETEKDPTLKGISINVIRPLANQAREKIMEDLSVGGNSMVCISDLQLHNVSLLSALKYTCLLSNLSFFITERGVVITTKVEGIKEAVIPVNQAAQQVLIKRLNSITVRQVNIQELSINEAVNSLLPRSRWQDPQSKEAINFVIGKALGNKPTIIEKLQLKEMTLSQALNRICEAANYEITVDDTAVILMPKKS
jgi:hypothetical protein